MRNILLGITHALIHFFSSACMEEDISNQTDQEKANALKKSIEDKLTFLTLQQVLSVCNKVHSPSFSDPSRSAIQVIVKQRLEDKLLSKDGFHEFATNDSPKLFFSGLHDDPRTYWIKKFSSYSLDPYATKKDFNQDPNARTFLPSSPVKTLAISSDNRYIATSNATSNKIQKPTKRCCRFEWIVYI